jgi:hypothetical protein
MFGKESAVAHRGRVRNGVVVLEQPVTLPEGAEVRVELAAKDQEDSSLEAKFQELVANWKAKSRFISSVPDLTNLPEYRAIIALGQPAVPLLLRELERSPDYWFWALSAITGADPVPSDVRGNVTQMRDLWLRWGRAEGYR